MTVQLVESLVHNSRAHATSRGVQHRHLKHGSRIAVQPGRVQPCLRKYSYKKTLGYARSPVVDAGAVVWRRWLQDVLCECSSLARSHAGVGVPVVPFHFIQVPRY